MNKVLETYHFTVLEYLGITSETVEHNIIKENPLFHPFYATLHLSAFSMAMFAKVLHVKMMLLWVALLVLIGSNEALGWLAPAPDSGCSRRRAASLSKSITLKSISSSQLLSRSTRLFTSSKDVNGDDKKISSNKVTEDGVAPNKEMDPITKASWYAVEWFGNAFGKDGTSSKENDNVSFSGPPSSLSETLKRIQLENDRAYFLSGLVDEDIYAPDCVFSDPFVSFEGRERFVTNLANLGSFITKYDAKVLKYEQPDDTTIETKVIDTTKG